MKRTLFVFSLLVLFSTLVTAQIEKGEELKRLSDYFVGKWTFSGESDWGNGRIPHSSWMACNMVMEGTWLDLEVFDDYNGQMQLYHKGLVTWDKAKGTYIFPHVSSNSTHVLMAIGRWIDERTFEFDTGDFDWDDGNTYRFLMRYEKTAGDVLRFTMRQQENGGELMLRLEGEYRRDRS